MKLLEHFDLAGMVVCRQAEVNISSQNPLWLYADSHPSNAND